MAVGTSTVADRDAARFQYLSPLAKPRTVASAAPADLAKHLAARAKPATPARARKGR
jgi:hypothetical protein